MPPRDRDQSYLWDIREAGEEIVSFTKRVKYAEFERKKIIRYAVERQLLVIGEAANHISPQFRNKHPENPWTRIIALRIAHTNMGKY